LIILAPPLPNDPLRKVSNTFMDVLLDFIKIVLPAGIILYAMYLTIRAFLNKQMEEKWLEMKQKNQETLLPVRIQAYERMCLFLERISPGNLILRLNVGGYTTKDLQQALLQEIREEFNHNVAQQIYMSNEAWAAITNAKEDVIMLINQSAEQLSADDSGLALAKKIFETMAERKVDIIDYALKLIKEEVRSLF
jgi:tRNA isopentenyl-2-thiomethyl-A-37 hydroxylase MiaE